MVSGIQKDGFRVLKKIIGAIDYPPEWEDFEFGSKLKKEWVLAQQYSCPTDYKILPVALMMSMISF